MQANCAAAECHRAHTTRKANVRPYVMIYYITYKAYYIYYTTCNMRTTKRCMTNTVIQLLKTMGAQYSADADATQLYELSRVASAVCIEIETSSRRIWSGN